MEEQYKSYSHYRQGYDTKVSTLKPKGTKIKDASMDVYNKSEYERSYKSDLLNRILFMASAIMIFYMAALNPHMYILWGLGILDLLSFITDSITNGVLRGKIHSRSKRWYF